MLGATQAALLGMQRGAVAPTPVSPITSGLVGFWPFYSDYNDYSGNNRHGIVDGTIAQFGQLSGRWCAQFRGAGRAEIPSSGVVGLTAASFSLRFRSAQPDNQIVMGAKGTNWLGYWGNYDAGAGTHAGANTYHQGQFNSSTNIGWNKLYDVGVSTTNLRDGLWHTFGLTQALNGNALAYIDGEAVYINYFRNNTAHNLFTLHGNYPTTAILHGLLVGGYYFHNTYSGDITDYKAPAIDACELFIFNRALSASEMATLHNFAP